MFLVYQQSYFLFKLINFNNFIVNQYCKNALKQRKLNTTMWSEQHSVYIYLVFNCSVPTSFVGGVIKTPFIPLKRSRIHEKIIAKISSNLAIFVYPNYPNFKDTGTPKKKAKRNI